MGSCGTFEPDYDVIIIGAGLSGIYSLILMRELKLRVRILEAGGGVGGVWYWNRYPGARFDSESWSYGYSFSQEILDEWHWKEHFSPQRETLKYIEFVANKFDLLSDMQFDTRVKAAHFQDGPRLWLLTDQNGNKYSSRYIITAMGPLTEPTLPNIPGVQEYEGIAYHTARWPAEPVNFSDKKVALIGTGATGIQTIQELVKTVGSLTVFQRTPNWTAPLHNSEITSEEMKAIRQRYPEIFKLCRQTPACFTHVMDPRKTFEVPEEERVAFWESLYAAPGFGTWLGNFSDITTNQEANDAFSDFMAKKIRQRVRDPVVAEMLIPKNHGFGTRRVPLETSYYECFNMPNIKLVDINETPIERITKKGIKTTAADMEFDIIIYATGFDALIGTFDAIDFQGLNSLKLKDAWANGPRTYLGMTVEDFPNMFMIMGPHQAAGNVPRSIEYAAEWIGKMIKYCEQEHISLVNPLPEGVQSWTEHVHEISQVSLSSKIDSWMTGVNKNVAGRQKRQVVRYGGSAVEFRKRCDAVAADGYAGFAFAK